MRTDEIRARCEAATPGPWEVDTLGQYVWQKENITSGAIIAEMRGWGYLTGMNGGLFLSDDEAIAIQTANAKFIANAPEDIRYLLDDNTAKDAEIVRLKSNIKILEDDAMSIRITERQGSQW